MTERWKIVADMIITDTDTGAALSVRIRFGESSKVKLLAAQAKFIRLCKTARTPAMATALDLLTLNTVKVLYNDWHFDDNLEDTKNA